MRITKKIKEQMVAILEETYRGVKPALIFRNPFELLVAVILSAQCTDKRVNVTTARLFAKAPTPEAVAALGLDALEEEEQKEFLEEMISPKLYTMFVTPKDVDETVRYLSFTISEGLNMAFSDSLIEEDRS